MTINLVDTSCLDTEQWQAYHHRLQNASSLSAIVWAALAMGLWVARNLVEQELERRAQMPIQWSNCPECGHRLRSKGFRSRRLQTILGVLHWHRRVGRCPHQCKGSHVSPRKAIQIVQVLSFYLGVYLF